MVLHIKEEFSVLLKTKMVNDQVEQQNSSYMETVESNVNIKPEEIDIKLEEFGYESAISIKKESQIEGDFNVVDNIKQESTNIDENQFEVKNEAWDIENQQTALTSTVIKSRSPVGVLSSNPEGGHTLGHQNTLEDITSTFETSPQNFFKTKRKGALIKHIKSHQKTKFRLNNSEKVLFKCEQCSYECKQLYRLHSHMLVHKDPSQLNKYECTKCNFKTNYKKNLKDHSFLHKDLTELPSYKCNLCDYETKRKDNLSKHMGMHEKTFRLNNQVQQKPKNTTNSVKVLLKCEQCSYECNKLSVLDLHMRIHKDPSELNMYECSVCNFKTKHKRSLRDHSISHEDAADIPRYICNSCGFVTKRKRDLRRHQMRHQKTSRLNNQEQQKPENITNSEQVMLKCEQCSYECKELRRLHSHMRIHKDPSELNMYECTQCDFKTKHAKSLKYHSLLHKDPAELPSYKCNSCNYETKRKDTLRKHIGRHQKNIQAEQIGTTGTTKCEEFEEVLLKSE